MFKIDFDKVFASKDSDCIKAIGMKENKLYITHHRRARVVRYYEGEPLHIEEARDFTYSYVFPIKKDLEKVYVELTNIDKIDRITLEKKIRAYVPTRMGKENYFIPGIDKSEKLKGERF